MNTAVFILIAVHKGGNSETSCQKVETGVDAELVGHTDGRRIVRILNGVLNSYIRTGSALFGIIGITDLKVEIV